MREHHVKSIENLIEKISKYENFIALILAGSLAHGTEKEFSDIDAYLVVTEEDFARRLERNDITYSDTSVCTYKGGYIDGKIIDIGVLRRAVLDASEPMRASFRGSRVLWSRNDEVEELVGKIAVFDESKRNEKLISFYSRALFWLGYFYGEGVKNKDAYLMTRSVTEGVFYVSRYILEKNSVLFPCHKDLMKSLEEAPDKPNDYIARANDLLTSHTPEKVASFLSDFRKYAEYKVSSKEAGSIFIKENEWNWFLNKNIFDE